MRKYLVILSLAMILVLTACGSEDGKKESENKALSKEEDAVEVKEIEEEEKEEEEEAEKVEEAIDIDTSMYEYSKEVKVTDAMEINDYVSLIIQMNDGLNPGLAFQHATNQTYDFLQQDALQAAEKVGINIILNDQKIAMYEITLAEFETNDEESMAQLVLDAAVMQMIQPEVEEYAETMELKYKED